MVLWDPRRVLREFDLNLLCGLVALSVRSTSDLIPGPPVPTVDIGHRT